MTRVAPGLRSSRSAMLWNYAFIVIVVVYSLVPFYWVFVAAFDKNPQLWLTTPQFTLQNFVNLVTGGKALVWMVNSLIYAVGTLVLVLFASVLGGYTLSRLNFWWKTPFLFFIILIRIIPRTTFLVPHFKLVHNLGLLDTYFSVILVDAAFSLPLALWIMKTFYDTIQIELEEAVWIDGGTRLTSLIRVVLPLSAPAVGAISVITFNGAWGTFLSPLIFITSTEKLPLGLGIYRAYITSQYIDYAFMAALAVVYLTPTVVLFLFFRKYVIKSFNIAGVTG